MSRVQQGELNHLNDKELMRMYQDGQMEAFETLYSRHSGRLYGFLRKRLRDRDAIDDVYQQTFLKLHNSRSQYDPTLPFLPWLFTITQSVMTDYLRKAVRDRNLRAELTLETEVTGAPGEPRNSNVVSLPLSELSERQREAIQLRYEKDFSFDEIAEKLNTSPVNVRQILSRALKLLKASGKDSK